MTRNIYGKEYDMRPYRDQAGRVVITRGSDRASFWMVNGKVRHMNMNQHRIDTFAFYRMVKQYITVKDKELPVKGSHWKGDEE